MTTRYEVQRGIQETTAKGKEPLWRWESRALTVTKASTLGLLAWFRTKWPNRKYRLVQLTVSRVKVIKENHK